jgi:DNA-binding MarR family transcriptional regulator
MPRTSVENPRTRKNRASAAAQRGVKPAARPRKSTAGPRGDTPTFIRVLRQFRELFRVSQQHFQRVEATCGVSGAQLWALCEIQERPGLTVSELAHAMSIHLSTASNLLDKLETRKLVRRERASTDQRVVRVYVTREGEKVLKRAPGPAEGVIPDALQKLPAPAITRLHRDLTVLLELASIRKPGEGLKHLTEP